MASCSEFWEGLWDLVLEATVETVVDVVSSKCGGASFDVVVDSGGTRSNSPVVASHTELVTVVGAVGVDWVFGLVPCMGGVSVVGVVCSGAAVSELVIVAGPYPIFRNPKEARILSFDWVLWPLVRLCSGVVTLTEEARVLENTIQWPRSR